MIKLVRLSWYKIKIVQIFVKVFKAGKVPLAVYSEDEELRFHTVTHSQNILSSFP